MITTRCLLSCATRSLTRTCLSGELTSSRRLVRRKNVTQVSHMCFMRALSIRIDVYLFLIRFLGSSKKRDSNRLASNNNTVSPTKAVLSEDADKTDKLERLNAFGAIANSLNPKTLKRNYVSSDTLNSKAKMRSNQNVIERRNWSRAKLLTNEAMGSKLKENSNNIAEKWGNRNKEMTHEIWIANPFLKLNHMMQPASSVETSQSLKMHVDKTLCQKKSEFPKRLYPYRIRDSEDTSVTQRCNLNTITNISFGMSVANSPLVFKHSLSGNIGLNRDETSNDKRAKKKANSTNGTRSLVTIEESVEDNCVPHLIEKEARPKNAKVPSTCLTKDKTVFDLTSACNLVNRKIV